MNVNVKLSLTDEERNVLASYIDGKMSKRLASRKDVNSFVQGCLEAALVKNANQGITHTTVELGEADKLRKQGYDESYIRGWLQVANRHR